MALRRFVAKLRADVGESRQFAGSPWQRPRGRSEAVYTRRTNPFSQEAK